MKKRTITILLLILFVGVGVWVAVSKGTGAQAAQEENRGITVAQFASTMADAPLVTVYKNPTCACCGEWADHLRENGFRVEIEESASLGGLGRVKAEPGVPPGLASCHTATVDGYVLEGHVPTDVITQLLTERPEITGLAVPGMPAGVPGMPEAGPNRAPYEILAFAQDGSTRVYATR